MDGIRKARMLSLRLRTMTEWAAQTVSLANSPEHRHMHPWESWWGEKEKQKSGLDIRKLHNKGWNSEMSHGQASIVQTRHWKEHYRTSSKVRINTKKTTLTQIVISLLRLKTTENSLKGTRQKSSDPPTSPFLPLEEQEKQSKFQ